MKNFKLACLVFLLGTGVAQAAQTSSVPCEGFQIEVTNKLSDDLIGTTVELNGANIDPNGLQKINSHSTQTYTVKNSDGGRAMNGEFVFHTLSLPSKEVTIKFDLNNSGLICRHDDKSPEGDLALGKTRLPNKVSYTISN